MSEDKIQSLEAQVAALKGTIARSQMTHALSVGGVRKEALADAVNLMGTSAKLAFSESGEVVAVEVGGKEYDSIADAAKEWVTERAYLKGEAAPNPHQGAETKPQPAALVQSAFQTSPRLSPDAPSELPRGKTPAQLLEEGYNPGDLVAAGLARK